MPYLIVALSLLVALSPAPSSARSSAQSPARSQTPKIADSASFRADSGLAQSPARSAAQSQRAEIADLAWLEGRWTGTDGPLQMEEIWTSADGGALVGLHKDLATRGGTARMVSFEFLRIEAGADGVAYVAQPGGRPPTRFPLVESGPRRVVFANPAHDFPQRILYWIDDAGALHARIDGAKGGKAIGQEWAWTKGATK